MVDVFVTRRPDGRIVGFEIKGHSGFDRAGRDIVCAAASVTAYNAVGALGELAGATDCHIEEPGYMRIELPGGLEGDRGRTADIIMNTSYIGFKQIQGSYPDYLRLAEKTEVNANVKY